MSASATLRDRPSTSETPLYEDVGDEDDSEETTRLTRDHDIEEAAAAPPSIVKKAAHDPRRILMLHGDAGDDDLMRMLLQASGWAHVSSHIEFVCVNAPHACAPKPHLFTAFAQRGLYDKPSYFTWGLHAAAAEQRAYLEQSATSRSARSRRCR